MVPWSPTTLKTLQLHINLNRLIALSLDGIKEGMDKICVLSHKTGGYDRDLMDYSLNEQLDTVEKWPWVRLY